MKNYRLYPYIKLDYNSTGYEYDVLKIMDSILIIYKQFCIPKTTIILPNKCRVHKVNITITTNQTGIALYMEVSHLSDIVVNMSKNSLLIIQHSQSHGNHFNTMPSDRDVRWSFSVIGLHVD